jgi:hypothetical protein
MRQNCKSVSAVNVPTRIFKKSTQMKRFPFATRKFPEKQIADCIVNKLVKFLQKISPDFQKTTRKFSRKNSRIINPLTKSILESTAKPPSRLRFDFFFVEGEKIKTSSILARHP